MRSRTLALSVAVAAGLVGATALAAPAQAAPDATVTVVHGVPGLTVDVYANGDKVLSGFEPGTVSDPLTVPAGTYDLKVFEAGSGPGGDPAIEAKDVEVPAGANASVAAHLAEDGTPTMTPYVNDVGKVDPGKARLTVRHTAAAPAVDVRAGGQPVFEGLANPDEQAADVAAGRVEADVVLAGTEDVVIGPADLDLAEGTNTIVYAWGSAEGNDLALATQTIDGLHSAPSGVPAGEVGLADPDNGAVPASSIAMAVAAVLAAAAVAWSGLRLARARGGRGR